MNCYKKICVLEEEKNELIYKWIITPTKDDFIPISESE